MRSSPNQKQQGSTFSPELQQHKKLKQKIVYLGFIGGVLLGAILSLVRQTIIYIGLGIAVGCLIALVVMIGLSISRTLQNRGKQSF